MVDNEVLLRIAGEKFCDGCIEFELYGEIEVKEITPDNCCKYLCNTGKCPYDKEIEQLLKNKTK